MQRAVIVGLVALAALFAAREVLARTGMSEITLGELVEHSSLVLRVKLAAMPKVTEMITIESPPDQRLAHRRKVRR